MRFYIYLISAVLMLTAPVHAASNTYVVDPDDTQVAFSYTFGPDTFTGEFVDYDMDLSLDFDRVANSVINVRLDTTRAKAGFAFATQALRSKKVLNAKGFPNITFVSTRITGDGNTAVIEGNITVRGITKPLTLTAKLFRPAGTAATDLDNLKIGLTGKIDRHKFGASGFRKEVGPNLDININAAIRKQ